MTESQRYRSDIQGLRALAIVPVVLFHANSGLVPGGFVGVDIFFVISGYLITRILLRELDTRQFSIAGFYARRIKRLFPALFAMLLAVLTAGLLVLPPSAMMELGDTSIATIFFFSNIVFRVSDYFGAPAELKPLLHTWSLAVEEQFYLLFPLFLALAYGIARRYLGAMLWLGFLGSLALCVWATNHHPAAAFYLPVTRAFELVLGCILAVGAVPRLRNGKALDALSLIGIAMIGSSLFLIDGGSSFPGAVALIPCIGTGLVIMAGEGRTSIGGRLLSVAPLVMIGSISYSLYLWHWPILVYTRYLSLGNPKPGFVVIAVLLAATLGAMSWRWIEQPVLRRKANRSFVLIAGIAAMIAGSIVAALPIATGGFPSRFSAAAMAMFESREDHSPHRATCHGGDGLELSYRDNCVLGDSDQPPTVAIWGDSFGVEIAAALAQREAANGRSVMQITYSACPPALGYVSPIRPNCVKHNAATLDALIADERIRAVMLIANYEGYYGEVQQVLDGMERAAMALSEAGKRLVIAYPIPQMPFDVPIALGMLASRGESLSTYTIDYADHLRETAEIRKRLDQLSAGFSAARFMPARALCVNQHCSAFHPEAGALYFDDIHLSVSGSRFVLDRSPEIIAALFEPAPSQ